MADQALEFGFPRAVVEIGCAEVGVNHAILEHVIDGGQDRGGDGANGLLRAALGLKAEKLGVGRSCPWPAWPPMRTEPAWFSTTGRPRATGCACACPRFRSGRDTSPQKATRRPAVAEAAHVAADLGEDRQRRQPADPGDRHQQTDQVAKPGLGLDPLVKAREASLRLAVDYSDRLVQRVVLPQMQLQQEANRKR